MQKRFTLLSFLFFLIFQNSVFSQAVEIFENAKQSVVRIISKNSYGKTIGTGSGFCIGNPNYIITNYHVIDKAKQVNALFIKGEKKLLILGLKLVSVDRKNDLVMLKTTANLLKPLKVDLKPPKTGETVFAIGSPAFGTKVLDLTLTRGILSSTKREIGGVLYLQHDAPINPGNSGGPLLNGAGELIGVITSKVIFREGLGFAVPVEKAQIKRLEENFKVKKGILIESDKVDDEIMGRPPALLPYSLKKVYLDLYNLHEISLKFKLLYYNENNHFIYGTDGVKLYLYRLGTKQLLESEQIKPLSLFYDSTDGFIHVISQRKYFQFDKNMNKIKSIELKYDAKSIYSFDKDYLVLNKRQSNPVVIASKSDFKHIKTLVLSGEVGSFNWISKNKSFLVVENKDMLSRFSYDGKSSLRVVSTKVPMHSKIRLFDNSFFLVQNQLRSTRDINYMYLNIKNTVCINDNQTLGLTNNQLYDLRGKSELTKIEEISIVSDLINKHVSISESLTFGSFMKKAPKNFWLYSNSNGLLLFYEILSKVEKTQLPNVKRPPKANSEVKSIKVLDNVSLLE